jgi:hypothetical protein
LQSGRRINLATNNNGHLLDDKGNVVVDFVWGNLPLQPNDDRVEPNLLDWSLDNHIIADSGWGGYPLFTANSAGADVAGATDYILVPSVLGKTTALAIDALEDAGFATKAGVKTITTATAVPATKAFTAGSRAGSSTALTLPITAHGFVSGQVVDVRLGTPDAAVDGQWTVAVATTTDSLVVTTTGQTTAKTGLAGTVKLAVTAVARTAGSTLATLTVGNAHGFVAGQQVVVAGIDADVNGTWVVDATSTANSLVVITTGKTTVKALTGQTGTVVGLAGTVLSQSVAANATSIAPGTAITITPWA